MQIILIMSTKLHFARGSPARQNLKLNHFNRLRKAGEVCQQQGRIDPTFNLSRLKELRQKHKECTSVAGFEEPVQSCGPNVP